MRVIDSSVIAAFILQEPGWERLASYLVGWTLDIAFLETLNAIIKALRGGRMDHRDARIRIKALQSLKAMSVERAFKLLPRIADLALNSKLTVYDAAFIALAQEKSLPLVTLDRAQHDEAIRLGTPSTIPRI